LDPQPRGAAKTGAMLRWRAAAAASALAGSAVVLLLGAVLTLPHQDAASAGRRLAQAPARRLFFSEEYLPSLYLNYDSPTTQEQRTWFSCIDVTASTKASFFAVQRTQFGYLGIQQTITWLGWLHNLFGMKMTSMMNPYYGLVIFSAWNTDAGNCRTESVGEGASQDMFGGEGTGCQIKLNTAWGNEHNAFVTTATRTGNGRILLAGYWHMNSDPWRLVGSISVPDVGQSFGMGGPAAFIEQYYNSPDQDGLRMANYGPQYVETSTGQWVPVVRARFETTDSGRQAYYVGAVTRDGSQFTMGLAGESMATILANTPDGTVLTLRNPVPASQSAELQSWIGLRSTSSLPTGCAGSARSCGSSNGMPLSIIGKPSLLPDSLGMAFFQLLALLLVVAALFTICSCARS